MPHHIHQSILNYLHVLFLLEDQYLNDMWKGYGGIWRWLIYTWKIQEQCAFKIK